MSAKHKFHHGKTNVNLLCYLPFQFPFTLPLPQASFSGQLKHPAMKCVFTLIKMQSITWTFEVSYKDE